MAGTLAGLGDAHGELGDAAKRQELYLAPFNDGSKMAMVMHHERFVLQLNQAALQG